MSPPAPKILTPEYYRRLEEIEDTHPWARAMRSISHRLIERHGRGQAPSSLLDAGCGTGGFLNEIEQASPVGSTACVAAGCDLSPDGLRRAHARGVKRVAVSRLSALAFSSGVVEWIVCHDVMQHLSAQDASDALSEFVRALRPGGFLLIRTAARRGWGGKRHRDTPSYRQFEPSQLHSIVEAAGLEITFLARADWAPSAWADLRAITRPAPLGDVGLRLDPRPPWWKRSVLSLYWRLETIWIVEMGWRPPGGHTLFCVAQKSWRL